MVLIGLTGQSCAGKNEVALLLKKKGFHIIDADEVSRAIFHKYEKELILLFKDELNANKRCLKRNGNNLELDKKHFSTLLFSKAYLLKRMEDFILPKITDTIEKKIVLLKEENENVKIGLNAPTLHKTSLFSVCSIIIYVKAFFFLRFLRAVRRDGFYPLNIYKRFLSQASFPSQYLMRKSDILEIANNSSRARLEDSLRRKLDSVGL